MLQLSLGLKWKITSGDYRIPSWWTSKSLRISKVARGTWKCPTCPNCLGFVGTPCVTACHVWVFFEVTKNCVCSRWQRHPRARWVSASGSERRLSPSLRRIGSVLLISTHGSDRTMTSPVWTCLSRRYAASLCRWAFAENGSRLFAFAVNFDHGYSVSFGTFCNERDFWTGFLTATFGPKPRIRDR